jgi:hypothetical protein
MVLQKSGASKKCCSLLRGTNGSNPFCSSAESAANFVFGREAVRLRSPAKICRAPQAVVGAAGKDAVPRTGGPAQARSPPRSEAGVDLLVALGSLSYTGKGRPELPVDQRYGRQMVSLLRPSLLLLSPTSLTTVRGPSCRRP